MWRICAPTCARWLHCGTHDCRQRHVGHHFAAPLLIDEKLGRQVAVREGVPITGLMGVLVEAKHQELTSSVRQLVGLLEDRAGFRVSEAVKEEAFIAAGE